MYKTKFNKTYGGKLFPETFGSVRYDENDKFYVGALHEIYLNDEFLGVAKVYAVREFLFKNIRDVIAWLDSNMPTPKFAAMLRRMYDSKVPNGVSENTVFKHVVFKWEKREFKKHCELISEFFEDLQREYNIAVQN